MGIRAWVAAGVLAAGLWASQASAAIITVTVSGSERDTAAALSMTAIIDTSLGQFVSGPNLSTVQGVGFYGQTIPVTSVSFSVEGSEIYNTTSITTGVYAINHPDPYTHLNSFYISAYCCTLPGGGDGDDFSMTLSGSVPAGNLMNGLASTASLVTTIGSSGGVFFAFDPVLNMRPGYIFGDGALLTISVDGVAPGVPEPATWAMMLAGFFGLAAIRISSGRTLARRTSA